MIIHVSKISSRRVGSCCVGFFICVNILEEKSDDESEYSLGETLGSIEGGNPWKLRRKWGIR